MTLLERPDVFDLPSLGAPVVVDGAGDVLPDDLATWLGGLIYGPKVQYATEWCLFAEGMGPCPDDPGTAWADKARRAVARIIRKRTASCAPPGDHTARIEHQCTRCGAVIGAGDHYRKSVAPAWLSGTGRWEVVKSCTDCTGSAWGQSYGTRYVESMT